MILYLYANTAGPEVNFDEGTASDHVAVDSHGVINYDKRRNAKIRSRSLAKGVVLSNKGLHGPEPVFFIVLVILDMDNTGIFTKENWFATRIVLGTQNAFYKSQCRHMYWTCPDTVGIALGYNANSSAVKHYVYDKGLKQRRKLLTKVESHVIVDGKWNFDVGFLLDFTKRSVYIIDTKNTSIIYTCTGLPLPGKALWSSVRQTALGSHARLKSGKEVMADPKLKTMVKNLLQ